MAPLLKDIERNGNKSLGKPEPLRENFSGYWSRHGTETDRLIYCFDDKLIYIAADKEVITNRFLTL